MQTHISTSFKLRDKHRNLIIKDMDSLVSSYPVLNGVNVHFTKEDGKVKTIISAEIQKKSSEKSIVNSSKEKTQLRAYYRASHKIVRKLEKIAREKTHMPIVA